MPDNPHTPHANELLSYPVAEYVDETPSFSRALTWEVDSYDEPGEMLTNIDVGLKSWYGNTPFMGLMEKTASAVQLYESTLGDEFFAQDYRESFYAGCLLGLHVSTRYLTEQEQLNILFYCHDELEVIKDSEYGKDNNVDKLIALINHNINNDYDESTKISLMEAAKLYAPDERNAVHSYFIIGVMYAKEMATFGINRTVNAPQPKSYGL